MRIMQVIYSFMVGGSEMVAYNLCSQMSTNFTHAVASLENDGQLRRKFEDLSIMTFVIDRQVQEKIRPMFRLWNAMRKFKPDIVHTHHIYQLFYAWPGALISGAQIVHTEHEYYSLMNSKVHFRLKNISRICKFITGVNEETSLYLQNEVGIPRNKIRTITNGIDLNKFNNSSLSRQSLGLNAHDFVVAIVARLHPVKDHVSMIEAFRVLLNSFPQARLLIVGDGEERQKLETLALELGLGGEIKFLGMRTDVSEILSCVDVLSLSSKMEGLPLCILEGMAAKKAIVATAVGGIPSVVSSGVNGILVPPGDPSAMAAALLRLALEPAVRMAMGENGRRLVEQRYNLRASVAAYTELYQEAVS